MAKKPVISFERKKISVICYTKIVPKNHSLLKIKTSKDSQETEEATVQLFSTLPKLKNSLLDRLWGKNETLSFVILFLEPSI